VAAEAVYVAQRMALYAAGAEVQLRLALASPRGVGTALRALLDAPVELVMDLFDALFVFAASSNPQVGLARDLVGRLDAGWLASVLPRHVEERLSRPDAGWEDHRRLAELLSALGQRSMLAELVRRAALSDDEDIREVAADFAEGGVDVTVGLGRGRAIDTVDDGTLDVRAVPA
jgi:hypothetical protein